MPPVRLQRILTAVLVCALVATAAWWLRPAPPREGVTLLPRAIETAASTASAAAAAAVQAAPVPAATEAAASAPRSKSARLKQLMAHRTPAQAFEAYQLLRACFDAREQEVSFKLRPQDFAVVPATPAQACGDLDPGQLSSRMMLLREAALAGVRGAAQAFVLEGPDGMGLALGPGVVRAAGWWEDEVRQVMEVGARRGDVLALVSQAQRLENESDPPDRVQAWAYWLVANRMRMEQAGKPLAGFDRIAARQAKTMSPEDRQASEGQAEQLVQAIHQAVPR